MEVTTLVIILVCAAPPASSSVMVAMMKDSVTSNLVKRDLINLPSNPPLPAHSLSFSCPGPGIFADQESGCQVFHYCQHDGRMDSFFCPNHTLFNQRFFVCDWFYNVDCSVSDQFYHLNDQLYSGHSDTADKLSRALEPAIKITQDEILTSAASSPQLSTADIHLPGPDQLDDDIVVDDQPLETSTSLPTVVDSLPSSSDIITTSYDDVADPEPAAAAPVLTNAAYLDPVSDPEPAAYYSDNSVYSDPSSDPEPAAYYTSDPYTDPEPAAYYSDNTYDPVSDPEPAAFYADPAVAVFTSDPYTDPEPAAYYSDLSNTVYSDPASDPEPAAYYTSDPSSDPEPAAYYTSDPSSDPEPAAYYTSDPYTDPEPAAYYDSSDPEPYAAYSDPYTVGSDPEPAAYQPAQTPVFSSSYTDDGLILPTYQSNLLLDPSDPEPAADPEYSPY